MMKTAKKTTAKKTTMKNKLKGAKITYKELKAAFEEHEYSGKKGHLRGLIVFTEDSFTKPCRESSRTYIVSSDKKAFQPNMCGYSIWGSAIDGTDPGVRLEQYMMEEHGGKDGWKVDCCYLLHGLEGMMTNQLQELTEGMYIGKTADGETVFVDRRAKGKGWKVCMEVMKRSALQCTEYAEDGTQIETYYER